jgi:isopenicillin N synthase-like dioxygenase
VTWPVLPERGLAPDAIDEALRRAGGFFVEVAPADAGPLRAVLAAARDLFARPRAEKEPLAIERSPCFRGWSEMHNERDWREQLHLGWERPGRVDGPAYRRLEGPNSWPADDGWRDTITRYAERACDLGEALLGGVARALALDASAFGGAGRRGYLVMKLIAYHAQAAERAPRSGVAAHVDFSWLTVNLQDGAGLEVQRPDGVWREVAPRPDALWVHAGELLQHATGGRYLATPHRVTNRSSSRTRVSIPVFVNPTLDEEVDVLVPPTSSRQGLDAPHVHRVLAPHAAPGRFLFGAAEWSRKGLGGWCHACR